MQKRKCLFTRYDATDGWRIEEIVDGTRYLYYAWCSEYSDMKFFIGMSEDFPFTPQELTERLSFVKPAIYELLQLIDSHMERINVHPVPMTPLN